MFFHSQQGVGELEGSAKRKRRFLTTARPPKDASKMHLPQYRNRDPLRRYVAELSGLMLKGCHVELFDEYGDMYLGCSQRKKQQRPKAPKIDLDQNAFTNDESTQNELYYVNNRMYVLLLPLLLSSAAKKQCIRLDENPTYQD